jgi:hypothetical protein
VVPPRLSVGEALAEGERTQSWVEERLERMSQRAPEQFESATVDEIAENRGSAVLLTGFEVFQCCGRRTVLARAEFTVRRVWHPGSFVRSDLPIAEPVVHTGQAVRIVELRREYRRDSQRQEVGSTFVGEAS